MQTDPPLPSDGSCVECGGPRKLPAKRSPGYLDAQRDPFCSTVCCRAYHGADSGASGVADPGTTRAAMTAAVS